MAVVSKRPGMGITRRVFLECVVNAESVLPMDTSDGARVYGLLDLILWTAFGLDDLRLFRILVELENFRADFFATSAADALILIQVYFLAHFYLLASVDFECYPRPPLLRRRCETQVEQGKHNELR